MIVSPRFLPRGLFKQNIKFAYDKKYKIKEHLKRISNKKIILDYSQARIALFHLLKYSLPPKSKILTSSYTIFDMVNVIINAGHIPYFVDIDKDHLGPNIYDMESLIQKKIVNCVIFTHLHGYNVDLRNLSEVCKANNCLLIEDCAQSLWCNEWSINNKSPGYYSQAAIYSTGFYKNINTVSGGFLLLSDNNENSKIMVNNHERINSSITEDFWKRLLDALIFYLAVNKLIFPFFTFPLLKIARKFKIKFITNRAREEVNPKYIVRSLNDLRKMNSIQRFLIKYKNNISLDNDYKKKCKIARLYLDNLVQLKKDNLGYIPGTRITDNKLEFFIQTSFNQIPFITNDPEKLINYLQDKNFDIARQNLLDLNSLKIYSQYKINKLPIVSDLANKVILLPCYPESNPRYIVNLVKEINFYFYKN